MQIKVDCGISQNPLDLFGEDILKLQGKINEAKSQSKFRFQRPQIMTFNIFNHKNPVKVLVSFHSKISIKCESESCGAECNWETFRLQLACVSAQPALPSQSDLAFVSLEPAPCEILLAFLSDKGLRSLFQILDSLTFRQWHSLCRTWHGMALRKWVRRLIEINELRGRLLAVRQLFHEIMNGSLPPMRSAHCECTYAQHSPKREILNASFMRCSRPLITCLVFLVLERAGSTGCPTVTDTTLIWNIFHKCWQNAISF